MCGIAGYTGRTLPGKLEAMAQSMFHRGPDQDGMYRNTEVNFCMRRLAIVDLSTGSQPKFNSDRTVALVFNGEIYNYIELRQSLVEKGYVFESDSSDTEVIAHLYEEYGIDFISKLVGMFAIALVDHRTHELFLIRDRLGKKPIYYEWNSEAGSLSFASEFNTLILNDKLSHIDHDSVAWYFSQKAVPVDSSIDDRVKRVPPASYLRMNLENKTLEIKQYWALRVAHKEKSEPELTASLTTELESKLKEAVRIRMRADVEVGAFLSGGLDSSLIVALASQHTPKPLKTYCLTYLEEINHKSADRQFAGEVAKLFRTDHREVVLTPDKLLAELPKIVRQHGEPNCAVVAAWFIAQEMSKDLKVALSGDGADELFGSYFPHRLGAALRDLSDHSFEKATQFLNADETTFLKASTDANGKFTLAEVIDRFSLFSSQDLPKLLSPRTADTALVRLRAERSLNAFAHSDPLQQSLAFDCKNLLVSQILNYSDLLAMAHSLEVRTPFLDHRIVEFAFGLDSRLKIKGATTKRILKEVARKHLPENLIIRPKEGFVEPAVFWLRKELKEFCRSYLLSKDFNKFGMLNRKYVDSLVESFYESGDYYLGRRIWSLLMYAMWESQYDAK